MDDHEEDIKDLKLHLARLELRLKLQNIEQLMEFEKIQEQIESFITLMATAIIFLYIIF